MKESIFANEIKKACSTFDCFYYKIPDAYGMARFSPPKPFDAFVVYKGKYYAFEYKMVKSQTAFAFSRVRPHQIDNLMKVWKNGGEAFIVINYRMKSFNKVFCIPIITLIEIIKKSERKSIPFNLMEKYSIEIRKKKTWDVESFLNKF